MGEERTHSLLSPSSAERWLHCTPSARMCEAIPYVSNNYMDEGTVAHKLGELKLTKEFEGIGYNIALFSENVIRGGINYSDYYNQEMEEATDFYVDTVKQLIDNEKPKIFKTEESLDLSWLIPEGHGTADCLFIVDDTLHIVDLKYGQGVLIEAPYNEQLQLYALGTYNKYKCVCPIKEVSMTICQPRKNYVGTWTVKIQNLLEFEAEVKRKAPIAWNGEGECKVGRWCKFCRALATCEAQAKRVQEVKDKINNDINCLTLDELTHLLDESDEVINFLNSVKTYALNRLLNGEEVKEYKLVEGRSKRMFTDPNETVNCIKRAIALKPYYTLDDFFEHKLLPLTHIESMLGKKCFKEEFAEVVYTPQGKPTLAKLDDKRPDFKQSPEEAFKDIDIKGE